MAATEQNKATSILGKLQISTAFEGNASAELLGLPHGVKAAVMSFDKSAKELSFALEVAADATIGKHQNLFCKILIPQNGGSIAHQCAKGGVLRIDAPSAPAPAQPVVAAQDAPPSQAAPAPAPAEKPLSRLEQLRQKKQ
jgi:hypothetical protein